MARRPTRAPGTGVATSSNDGQGAMTEKKHLLDFPHVSHRDGIHSYFKLHANDAHVREGGAGTSWSVPKLCEAYGWPSKELKGSGVIGIIEVNGGWLQSDMEKYFAGIGQPLPTIIDVPVDGTSNSKCETASGDDAEVALDIQVAAASYFVATGKPATIKVYWSKDIAAAIRRATRDGCDVCSISWGADEALWPIAAAMDLEWAAEQAVNAGMIVFAAAGDNDSTDGGPAPANVDLPASAPHAIACGGTTKPNRARAQETVWNNDAEQTTGKGTGGGFSTVFKPMPLWQAGAPHGPGRMVPDVAANADPNTGYDIFVDGQPRVFGGNSAVAPLYAGLFAAFGTKLGFVAPELYLKATCFNDITEGDSGDQRAKRGPDPCTGLGTPNGKKLAAVFADPGAAATRRLRALEAENQQLRATVARLQGGTFATQRTGFAPATLDLQPLDAAQTLKCTGWVFPNNSNPNRPAVKAAVFQAANTDLNPTTTSDNIALVGGLLSSDGSGSALLALVGRCMSIDPFHADGLHFGPEVENLDNTIGAFVDYIQLCYRRPFTPPGGTQSSIFPFGGGQ